ncbi:MAG: DUF2959 family protein, partial [Planctomycetota bacterium]
MAHRHPLQRLLFVLPMLAGACASAGWEGARARVDDLAARVEYVYQKAEVTRARTAEALAHLRTLTAAERGQDALAVFAHLVKSIDAAEQQTLGLRNAVTSMQDAAAAMFVEWERDAMAIVGDDLRERALARLLRAKERSAAIVAAADAADVALGTFHRALRDYTLFLGHDLNQESLGEARAGVANVAGAEKEAATQLDGCMQAARAYASAVAMPTGGQT